MPTNSPDDVSVNIFANIAGLVTGFREGAAVVTEGSEQMAGSIEGLTGSIEALLAPLAAITALFETFSFIKESIENTNEYGEQVRIASQKTGIAVEQLQALQFAAKMADVDVAELTAGLGKLSKNLQEVAIGKGGPAAVAMEALGIKATDASGRLRPMEAVLNDVAAKFATMEDGTTKTALAMDLFGRSGANLIPLLNEGAKGIQEMEDRARALGIVMSEDDIEAAKRFDDEMKEFKASLTALEHSIGLLLMPTLIALAQFFVDHIEDVERFADAIWKIVTGFSFIAQIKKDREFQNLLEQAGRSTSPERKAPPILPPGKDPNAPSALELLREEWNKRKQIAIDNQEDILQLEINFWKQKLALEQEGTKDYITIHSHLVDLEEQQQKKESAALKKATDDWKHSLESLPSAFSTAFKNMRETASSFQSFMRDMWYDLVALSAKAGYDMLADYAAKELAKRNITKAGAVESIAIKTWEGIKWIAIEAAKAAASTWAAIASIPVVGPFLAPLAAGAALAGVLALAGVFGGHSGGGGAATTATSAGQHVATASANAGAMVVNIHAMDAKSFKDFAHDNRSTFVSTVKQGLKNNAGGGRG
jgi:hypothetical protein